jgi:hypothetical protein
MLERGLFDGLFLADVLRVYDVYGGNSDASLRGGVQIPLLDPMALVQQWPMRQRPSSTSGRRRELWRHRHSCADALLPLNDDALVRFYSFVDDHETLAAGADA